MLASVLKSQKAVQMNIAIEKLLAHKSAQENWADRERIGYKS